MSHCATPMPSLGSVMIKDIFKHVVTLRDRRFLLRYAPSLFPSQPEEANGKQLLTDLNVGPRRSCRSEKSWR